MDIKDMLQQLDSAVKGINEATLGDSILQPTKMARFIDAMQLRANVLQEVTVQTMTSNKEDLDIAGFSGRIITKGITSGGVSRGTEADSDLGFNTQTLRTAEFRAKTSLTDRALRRNIERGNLEDHLIQLMGEAAGRDWEEVALFGDLDLGDVVMGTLDGWFAQAGGQKATGFVFGTDSIEDLFEELLDLLPKQYLIDPAQYRFYVPWAVENAYRDTLKSRGTALGDSAQTGASQLAYKGIPVRRAPIMERNTTFNPPALLCNPSMMVAGVFHQITIEPDRDAANRLTNFYLTWEGDVTYTEANSAVACVIPAAT